MNILSTILKAAGIIDADLALIHIIGKDPILPSPFLIGEAGAAALAAVGYAASALWRLRTGRTQQIYIKVRDAAIAQRAHEYIQQPGQEKAKLWDPLSGLYIAADENWIQLHCNFPHHRQGVVDFLECEDHREAVATTIKNQWPAEKLEQALSDRGLCAAMVRSPEQWLLNPQAQAVAQLPLLEIIKIADSEKIVFPKGNRPLAGIRTLDLSRVIAGPVCGKTLAEHGAEILHITSPQLPFVLPLVMDNGFGKLSAHLDLNIPEHKQQLSALIQEADIFLQTYRPHALEERGFGPQQLAKLRPGIIYISLSAYSHLGPWQMRHGYDSLVQCATGLVAEQSQNQLPPKHLPAQSLDYITGYLAAFGAMLALHKRATIGGSYLVRVSLAQTAHWLKSLGRVTQFASCQIPSREDILDLLVQEDSGFGRLEHVAPALKMSETRVFYNNPSVPLGTHQAKWL